MFENLTFCMCVCACVTFCKVTVELMFENLIFAMKLASTNSPKVSLLLNWRCKVTVELTFEKFVLAFETAEPWAS